MKTTTIAVLIGLGIAAFIGVSSVVGIYNSAVTMEAGINAQYKDNQNVLGQYGLKVAEAARVSDKYKDAVVEVATAAIEGRYGEDGSRGVFQWLKEQNPVVDVTIYRNIQQIIEAGRNQFTNNQTMLLEKCRVYEAQRNSLFTGTVLNFFGFPKNVENLTKVCTPIVTAEAEKAFTSGKAEAIKF